MDNFFKAATKDEITPKRPKVVKHEEIEIVLFQIGDEYFAIENLCPHQLASAFHQAILDGYTITCPMHGWSFDIRSGKAIAGSGRIRTFEVQVSKNEVRVKRPDQSDIFSKF